MTEEIKPDIERQLRDAQEQREKLLEQLKESEQIIASIEARLNEVTRSQDARLRADDRVDNKLLDEVQRKKKPAGVDSGEHGRVAVDNGKKKGSQQQHVQVHVETNSWYEITVDEDGNKQERLRKDKQS